MGALRKRKGYRTTRYRFRGEIGEPTAFFGYFLQRQFRPLRLVVPGIHGSMWDHIFKGDVGLGDELQDLRLQLIDEVASQSVAQQTLDELSPALARALECDVTLRIIPAAASEPQQLEILRAMRTSIAAVTPAGLFVRQARESIESQPRQVRTRDPFVCATGEH